MRRMLWSGVCLAICGIATAHQEPDALAAQREFQWHQWRGPAATGVAPHGDPPVHFGEEENLRWKRKIPGRGYSTPIIWEDRVFVLTAIDTEREAEVAPVPAPDAKTAPPPRYFEFVVLCFDRESGDTRWEEVATTEVPHAGRHSTNTFASASPCTDGERLYVPFGSRGMFCYDLEGTLLWKRDLGDMRTRFGWGEGCSPVVQDDLLVVNWDHEDQSFCTALDRTSGETRWKVDRDERSSWATPLIVPRGTTHQVITTGNRVRSYDLQSGKLLWECGGLGLNAIPSPVTSGGLAYCMVGFRTHAVLAIPLDAQGDVTASDQLLWTRDKGTPYVPSPLLYGDRLYYTGGNNAVLTCLEARTGKAASDRQRLPELGNLYASPVGAAGRIYFADREGTVLVISHRDELEVLAAVHLDDAFDASPAIAGRDLFLRGQNLYCFSTDD